MVILIAEYVGDFLLQSREMALNKSKNIHCLMRHLIAIFCCIAITGTGLGLPAVYLAACYVVIHGVQDWYIWKGYKYLIYKRFKNKAENEKDIDGLYSEDFSHNQSIQYCELFEKDRDYAEDKLFYDTIGLDRTMHVITLTLLYGVFFL